MNEDYKTKDYSYLEGKTIKYIYDIDGYNEEFEAVVSGCDYEVGISIEVVSDKEKEHVKDFYRDSDSYLYCLPGPSTKEYITNYFCINGFYDISFLRTLKCIEEGTIRSSYYNDLRGGVYSQEMSECTFK